MDATLQSFRVHGAALYQWASYIAYVFYSCFYFACEVTAGVLEVPTDAPQYDALTHQANSAATYAEWLPIAATLDDMDGLQKWRTDEVSTAFSFEGVMRTIEGLLELRSAGSPEALLDGLQKHVLRSLYGISHRRLYLYRTGTKTVIHSYNSLVCFLLGRVGDAARTDRQLALRTREVLSEMYHVYGSTALLLKGGLLASAAHFGVAKVLFEADMLPPVIYGSGSGALVATLVCCSADLPSLFQPGSSGSSSHGSMGEAHRLFCAAAAPTSRWQRLRRLFHTGEVVDPAALNSFLQQTLGDVTFAEAYARTGRVLNIPFVSASPLLPRSSAGAVDVQLLNYLTSPKVLVRSAVLCAMAPTSAASRPAHGTTSAPSTLLARTRLGGHVIAYDPPVVHQSYATSCGDHAGYGVLDPVQRMCGLFFVRFCVFSDASLRGYTWHQLRRGAAGDELRPRLRVWDWLRYVAALCFLGVLHVVLAVLVRLGYEAVAAPSLVATGVFVSDDEGEGMRVYPISRMWSYLRLLYSPTAANIATLMLEGEREVWPRLEQLRMSISVEQVLAATLKRLPTRK